MTPAERVVEAILRDLEDRAGFDHWWDGIEMDIQEEIRETLVEKVAAVLNA